MHRVLSIVVLSFACATAHAQVVTAEPSTLEFAPMTIPSESATVPLTLTNNSAAPVTLSIEDWGIWGIGFGWYAGTCGEALAAGASCAVGVQTESWAGYPLGVYEAQFQVVTSANDFNVPLRVYAYSREALPGLQNLSSTIDSQTLPRSTQARASALLRQIERLVTDSGTENDAMACPRLTRVDDLLEAAAAEGSMSEWLAASLVVQSKAIGAALGCDG